MTPGDTTATIDGEGYALVVVEGPSGLARKRASARSRLRI
jgi:hypothetical protein